MKNTPKNHLYNSYFIRTDKRLYSIFNTKTNKQKATQKDFFQRSNNQEDVISHKIMNYYGTKLQGLQLA